MFKKLIIILSIIFVLFSKNIGALIASLFGLNISSNIGMIVSSIICILLTFILVKFLYEKLLKTDTKIIGMPKFSIKPIWIVIAVLLPIIITSIFVFCFSGEFISSNMTNKEITEKIFVAIIVHGLCAGFVEELLFRGILFHLLEKKFNKYVAIIAPSVLFAVLHIDFNNFSVISCIFVMVAGTAVGVMFSTIMLESNSIWNSCAVHSLWNMIIIGEVISISDKVNDKAIFTYVLNLKSIYITGGEFGIESSVISITAYIIITIIAVTMIKNNKKKQEAN